MIPSWDVKLTNKNRDDWPDMSLSTNLRMLKRILRVVAAIVISGFLPNCAFINITPTETPTAPIATNTLVVFATATNTRPPPTATPSSTIAILNNAPDNTPTATPNRPPRQGDILPTPWPTSTNSPVPGVICVVGSNSLNLRQGPGQNYRVITSLPARAELLARQRVANNTWLQVSTTRQEIGWVYAELVACKGNLTDLSIAMDTIAPTPFSSPPPITPAPSPTPTATPTPAAPFERWRGEYYDNASLLGDPVLIREDENLEFNWILDSPAPGIPSDNFSVRWTGIFNFIESGDYRFFATVDDGIRLYVDGWLVIDAWHTALPVPYEGDFADLQVGPHTIVVEYFESGGHAHIKVWAQKTVFVDSEWRGEYYNNVTLQDPVTFIRGDQTIDFDWGKSGPDNRLKSNNFSVRWQRTLFLDPGDYQFFAAIEEEDNVKLSLDGWEILNHYSERKDTVEGFFAKLGGGYHTLEVEYQDHGGRAAIKFWWERQ